MAEPVIAIVGAETLLGRELRDVLGQNSLGQNSQRYELRLIAEAGDEVGLLTVAGGEPSVFASLDAASLEGASAIVLAGASVSAVSIDTLGLNIPLIDPAGVLEDRPSARLRAPLLEPHDFRIPPDAIQVIAHPAAVATALVLSRIHQVFPLRRSLIHIFEPASERGTAGIDELQHQTVNLLSFKPLPKKVYDAQVSYNMLAAFGEEAPVALAAIEARIERHLATLLSFSGQPPFPSIRLIQAPVFHGYSFSLWLEFETNPGPAAIQQVLNEPPLDVHGADVEPPNNVGQAGQEGVAVGAIQADRNNAQALWLWMAADNLRLTAQSCLQVLREVV